jgi:hypothetical protein
MLGAQHFRLTSMIQLEVAVIVHLSSRENPGRQVDSCWQVMHPTGAHRSRWAAAAATLASSAVIIETMKAGRTRAYVADVSMWRMHFVVHVRLRGFARHAVAVQRSDTRVINDAAQTPEVRNHSSSFVAKSAASQHILETLDDNR